MLEIRLRTAEDKRRSILSDEILLESGTNEVEILEFYVGGQSYGINVAKVMQIELLRENLVTKTPGAGRDGFMGVFLWRGTTLPMLDLAEVLGMEKKPAVERPIVLVTEFNAVRYAFLVDGVNQVYRSGWEQIKPISHFLGKYSSRTTATLEVEKMVNGQGEINEILLLDFESIVGEYSPETKLGYRQVEIPEIREPKRREEVRIVLAEDSAFLREMLIFNLKKAGYIQTSFFENGQAALDYLTGLNRKSQESGRPFAESVSIVITDIEMPLMDGLTLCRRIRKDLKLEKLPVIFFSSLINEQMMVKCKEVGGNGQITKPELGSLVSLVDELCLR
ncbi:MAG: chemotaxis protein [Pseudomonadota bacterium]